MPDLAERIAAALRATAPAMSALSEGLDVPLRESELGIVFALALRRTRAERSTVRTEYAVDFLHWQPKVGKVDTALLSTEGKAPPALIELKWGGGTLYNCIWDLAKMATAIAEGHVARSFLIAGAPATDWTSAVGRETFQDRTWLTRELFASEYLPGWKKWWEEVKTRPQALPAEMETRTVDEAPMTIRGALWSLRLAEVTRKPGGAWVPVPTCAKSADGWRWA